MKDQLSRKPNQEASASPLFCSYQWANAAWQSRWRAAGCWSSSDCSCGTNRFTLISVQRITAVRRHQDEGEGKEERQRLRLCFISSYEHAGWESASRWGLPATIKTACMSWSIMSEELMADFISLYFTGLVVLMHLKVETFCWPSCWQSASHSCGFTLFLPPQRGTGPQSDWFIVC